MTTDTDRPKTDHALTFIVDHLRGADQGDIRFNQCTCSNLCIPAYYSSIFNNKKEVVQCLIVLRFGLQLKGIGSSPLKKLTSTDVIDLWSLLGPNLTMEGSLSTGDPSFYAFFVSPVVSLNHSKPYKGKSPVNRNAR
jgi:hypothetical protein